MSGIQNSILTIVQEIFSKNFCNFPSLASCSNIMKYLHIDQVGYQVVTMFWFLVFIYLQIVKTNCLIQTLLTELSSLRLVLGYQSLSFLNSSTNSSAIFSLEVLPVISSDFPPQ